MSESKMRDEENDCLGGRDCCGIRGTADGNISDDNKKYACMSACRWFPLFIILLGIVAVTAGYVLNPSTIRIIWLAFSIVMTGLGLLCLLIMATMVKKPAKISCC